MAKQKLNIETDVTKLSESTQVLFQKIQKWISKDNGTMPEFNDLKGKLASELKRSIREGKAKGTVWGLKMKLFVLKKAIAQQEKRAKKKGTE